MLKTTVKIWVVMKKPTFESQGVPEMTTQPEALRLFTRQLLDHDGKPNGVHIGCDDLEVCKQSHVDGETSPVIHEWVVGAELRRLSAENEHLKTVPMKYRRMEFNAQLQTENDRLRAQLDALLEFAKYVERCKAVLNAASEGWRADAERWQAQRDALLEKIKAVIAAEQSEDGGRGGFVNKAPTREHQRRVTLAWQELHAAIKQIEGHKT